MEKATLKMRMMNNRIDKLAVGIVCFQKIFH